MPYRPLARLIFGLSRRSRRLVATPQATDAAVGDGGQASYSETWGSGKELGLTVSYEGLKVGIYGSERENTTPNASTGQQISDEFNGAWYAKYSFGPVSVGYQTGGAETGVKGVGELATTAKAYTTAFGNFEYEKMSIAANVNENMSISWGELKETYDAQNATSADVEMKSTSIQFAYSMGSMKISGYMTDTDNPGWDSNAESDEVTELAVGFSF